MKNLLKNLLASTLVVLLVATPCYAIGDFSYTTTETETYTASSPTGNITSYYGTVPNTNYYVNTEYYQEPAANYGYNTYQASAATYNPQVAYNNANYNSVTVNTPQTYNRTVTTTTTFRDERSSFDKNLDRTGKVIGVLGGATILGLGAAAIIKSF